ncbi:hypothetical protein D9619_006957 [Psilocybe cf. subviscida]|uniref:alpha-1,6-mannosyl-glycoprotein 6-beta-N-acetylglucosaminyltransferase n=1 Tax=Psilocybe cf. subviscida TaxID=2480587 RepID=A0A8H5B2C9_9AGAR|nr:hypothetical protein D9619_006957 [Psilocybe cf. subviscida]
MSGSEEDYELLPTTDALESQRLKRRTRGGGCLAPLRRVFERRPNLLFYLSLTLFISALVFTTYDVVYLKTKLALTKSYNSFVRNLWPVGLPNVTDNWENENSKAMHTLLTCMSTETCSENQTSIVLLSSFHFANSISGHVSGEDIWAASVLLALRQMGYTPIFATNNDQLARTYRQYPDLIKIVILEGASADECFRDGKCIKTANHPLGIPAWKMFSFHFWGGSSNPLGNAWTLSPENYAITAPQSHSEENIYLGYSIESTCMKNPVMESEDRPRQAYILAKMTRYLFNKDYAWPGVQYDQPPFEVDFLAGFASHDEPEGSSLPKGIKDLGRLNKTTFYRHVGESKALVGVGNPFLSPSPYDALCMGVPFINPILSWDRDDPENRTKWASQHDTLKFQDPPYVYNVRKNDTQGFWEALGNAMDTPIERYIVPEMTMEALKYRVGKLVEGNWKEKAERLLEERKASGKGAIFEL